MATCDLRLCPVDTVAQLRRQAVRLAATGIGRNAIADRLGLRRATITAWLQTFRKQGTRGLSAVTRGRPPAAPVSSETVLRLLLVPPAGAKLWTARQAADLIASRLGLTLSPRSLLKLLITAGLLPRPNGLWKEQTACQEAIQSRPHCQPYLLTATPLGSHERGWTFNLLDTTGRYAFLFTLGSLRLARWIVFLERAKTCVAGRSQSVVDYALTSDRLAQAIAAVKVVMGCGHQGP